MNPVRQGIGRIERDPLQKEGVEGGTVFKRDLAKEGIEADGIEPKPRRGPACRRPWLDARVGLPRQDADLRSIYRVACQHPTLEQLSRTLPIVTSQKATTTKSASRRVRRPLRPFLRTSNTTSAIQALAIAI